MDYYTNNSMQAKRRVNPILIVIVLVVLAVGGTLLYMTRFQHSKNAAGKDEVTVAKQFTEAVLAGKADESYDLMTTRAKKTVVSKEAWTQQLANTKGQSTYTQLGSTYVEQPEASYGKGAHPVRINYSVKTQDGHDYDYYVIVTLENNVPKIDEFDTYTK